MKLRIGQNYRIKRDFSHTLGVESETIKVIGISTGAVTFTVDGSSFKINLMTLVNNIVPENDIVFSGLSGVTSKPEPQPDPEPEPEPDPEPEPEPDPEPEPEPQPDPEPEPEPQPDPEPEPEPDDPNGSTIIIKPNKNEYNDPYDDYNDPYGGDNWV